MKSSLMSPPNPPRVFARLFSILVLLTSAALANPFAGGDGTAGSPYQVATAAHLEDMRTQLSEHFVLTANIDMAGVSFVPIGSQAGSFTGTFEGSGFTISNLNSTTPGALLGGLFGVIGDAGHVQNLVLSNCQIEAVTMGGALAGWSSGTIVNCSSSGTVTGGPGAAVGGLLGYNSGTLTSSHSSVALLAPAAIYDNGSCGGLCGTNAGAVLDCHATGSISLNGPSSVMSGGLVGMNWAYIERSYATGSVAGRYRIGGLVGMSLGAHTTISKCYATGAVTGNSLGDIGGLIGYAGGTISDCYATGSVNSDLAAAGLIGRKDGGAVIRCYAIGLVTAQYDGNAHGLISNYFGSPSIVDSYWDTTTSGTTYSALGAGLTTSELQDPATFATWDLDRVWVITPGQYPTLRTDGLLLPVIVVAPVQVANKGSDLTLAPNIIGQGPFTYRWEFGGVTIPGATSSTFTIVNADEASIGSYAVIVTNSVGTSIAYCDVSVAGLVPEVYEARPGTIIAGSGGLTLAVLGNNFAEGYVVRWNGVDRPTTFFDSYTLEASIPATDTMATGSDLNVAVVTVVNPAGEVSNPVSLPIVTTNVTTVQSNATAPNAIVTVSTAPTFEGTAGVTTTFANNDAAQTTTIAVANYATNPTSTPYFEVGGQYVDVQAAGASASDVASTTFYYPTTITGATETDLTLLYFNGVAWTPVLSIGGAVPAKDLTDNLDGTVSGGRFVTVFDATSTPAITELTGTVFTFAPPPVVSSAARHKPKITSQPQDVTATTGATITFTVAVAVDGTTTYQWFSDKRNGAPIAGATSATLTLQNVTLSSSGNYVVVATNSQGATSSSKAVLTVVPAAPVILTQPQSQIVSAGTNVTLTVAAASESAVTYQWLLNGKKLGGKTDAALLLKKVSSADAGSYTAIVTNAGGSSSSASASLTVQK